MSIKFRIEEAFAIIGNENVIFKDNVFFYFAKELCGSDFYRLHSFACMPGVKAVKATPIPSSPLIKVEIFI